MAAILAASAWVSAPALAADAARRGRATLPELASQVEQVAGQLKNASDNLRVVETQYTQRAEPTDEEALLRRFSNGEIQYLLGDYPGASVLFYDLISDPRFKGHARYPDALFYLADALYQQGNFIGAKVYLRELLAMKAGSAHYREALIRFLEVAGRLNEFAGIDSYIQEARGPNGDLAPELAYVYGKWLFKRTDLTKEQRLAKAREVFEALAADAAGLYRLQSGYFLGVLEVQRAKDGDYAAAIQEFQKVVQARPRNEREAKVKELANLALGRVLYEGGKYDEALDRYQEVARESENYIESLYEIAWVHVRKGQWELAKNAAELVDELAPESTLAPEAKILKGHLLLKLKRYDDAHETYIGVINKYAPVRDEIDALLSLHKDPVVYFDELLSRNESNLDVASILPAVAQKWATTQREVADAVRMVNDIESGKRGVAESEEIVARILKALDEHGMEAFPAIQEGYTRADAVDTALAQSEQSLVRLEGYLLEDQLTPEEKAEYERLRQELEQLQKRFASLPTNETEVEARKKRMQTEVDRVDKQAFKLGYELQSLSAVKAAMEKWLDDTRPQRRNTPEEEKAFAEQLRQEGEALSGHQKELDELRQQLSVERSSADASIAGEDALRAQYTEQLRRQHALLGTAEGRLGPDAAKVLARAHEIRNDLAGLRERVTTAKGILRAQLARRGRQIREKVQSEQALLAGYTQGVTSVSGDARHLVGQIAFDSFKRVKRQFHDLVLKADVGVVDVAFTRKQDKTSEIQKIASQKDRELKALDEEFKEVLKDVD